MTEHEWLASKDPAMMLRTYTSDDMPWPAGTPAPKVSDRKLRLFSCACVRHVWHLLTDEHAREAVEAGELRADDNTLAGKRRRGLAFNCADLLHGEQQSLAYSCLRANAQSGSVEAAFHARQGGMPPYTQASLLREIVGNPYRPVSHPFLGSPHLLGGTVLTLARVAYEDRPGRKCKRCFGTKKLCVSAGTPYDPPDYEKCDVCHGTGRTEDGTLDPLTLAALADALEEAGCLQEETLPCPECSPYLDNPCPRCDGKKKVHEVGTPYDSDWQVCLTCKDSWKFPAGYRPERDPASGHHEGGWTNCKTCNDGRASAQPGVVCKANPILAHLRSPGPHVRGCWVIDLILGNV